MLYTQAEFARAVGVCRQAIYHNKKKGYIVAREDGKIDSDHPKNRAYMVRRAAGTAHVGPPPGTIPKRTRKSQGPDSKAAPAKSTRVVIPFDDSRGEPGSSQPVIADEQQQLRQLRTQLNSTPDGGSNGSADDEVIREIKNKGYWDAIRAREEARIKMLQREKDQGRLIDISLVEGLIAPFIALLTVQFVESPEQQGLQIAQMLGMESHMHQIVTYLQENNEERLREADRAIGEVCERLKEYRKGGALSA